MSYKYKAVPFIGNIKGEKFDMGSARTVADQLSDLINQNAVNGWEYYSTEKVGILTSPGCLASLMGAKGSFLEFDQVIFRKQV